jgi:beta-galactosidase
MKTPLTLLLMAMMLGLCPIYNGLYGQSRSITGINSSWKFKLGDDSNASKPLFDDSSWGNISLPHTWNNLDGQDGGNNYFRGIGWYRRSFHLGSISGKRIFLKFNAANLVTEVYVNGSLAGRHTGGYSAFIFDISNLALAGQDNVVAVRVSNDAALRFAPLSGDFNFCGGITGGAELWVTNNILVSPLDYASSGIYITPKNITASHADINVQVVLGNFSAAASAVTETYNIKDAGNTVIATLNSNSVLSSFTSLTVTRVLPVNNPVLWQGMKNPYLYTLEVILKVNGIEADRLSQKFGIRTISANPNLGVFLNGISYPLHGLALHEDRKDKGRAISDKDRKDDLDLLKETGLNYVRLSHYQHGQATYNYCDSTGIVVSTEIPLLEQIDNSTAFTDNIKDQLRELIKQNYNHPSVCFWGLFNELFAKEGPDPTQLVFDLNTLAKTLDNTRLTTAASITDGSTLNFYTDVISYNRYFGWYYNDVSKIKTFLDSMHRVKPANAIGLSEYGAGASIHQHADNPPEPVHNGPYHPEEYQNYFHEYYWQAIKERPFLFSTSVWNAFDYASDSREEGDALGINDKGLVTHDRQTKKDAFYLYKANWSSSPVVYITSRRFTERTSAITTIKVYSNADSVEIRVNNKSKGYQKSADHVLQWKNITLDNGINRVKAYGLKNKVIYQDSCTWICSNSSIVRSEGCSIITARSGNLPTENANMAFDNLTSTKWYNFNTSGNIWIQYQFCNGVSYGINSYRLTSANDSPLRDPKTVILYGSNDGVNFALLDSRTNIAFTTRFQTQTFIFTNSTAYQYYRFDMTANTGNDGLQISEIELMETGADGTVPNAPSALNAVAVSGTSISLTWQDNSANENGFEIYHSSTSGSGFTLLTTTGANVTTYTHNGLTASTTHYYRVRAINGQGNSAYTSEASATTPSGSSIIRSDGCGNITARGGNPGSEPPAMAFDNLTSTKWYNFNTSGIIWIQYQFCNGASYAINSYTLTSANDMPLRDPKTVSISGSNDGVNFTLLDTKTNIVFSSRFQTQTFNFTNSTAYQYYRFDMVANTGNDGLQVAEIELIETGAVLKSTQITPAGAFRVTAAPNPFRDGLTIDYYLPGDTHVKLDVYDLKGRIVQQLVNENQAEGPHRIFWDALNNYSNNLHNGIYILKIESAIGTEITKIIYME